MYPAWRVSWISGIAAAVATITGIAVYEIATASSLKLSPDWFMLGAALLAGALACGVVAIAVRGGLHVARCRSLELGYALFIPAFFLPIVGFLVTRPAETYAFTTEIPTAFMIGMVLLGPLYVPALVSYAVGRLALSRQIPPDKSPELAQGSAQPSAGIVVPQSRPRLILSIIGATLLAIGLVWWAAPAIREVGQHLSCVKREEAKGKLKAQRIVASLGKRGASRTRVVAFLRANYPGDSIWETADDVASGHMFVKFDENDQMIGLIQAVPCPIS
jgi:hypothetical protein